MDNENNTEVIESLMDEPTPVTNQVETPVNDDNLLHVESLDITIDNPNKEAEIVKPPKKKRKAGKILGTIIFLLILGFIFYFCYQFFVVNPKSIYTTAINKSFAMLNTGVNDLNNLSSSKEGNISFTTSDDEYKLLENLNINYTYLKKDNDYHLDLTLNEDEKSILQMLLFTQDNRFFIKANSLYSKILSLFDYTIEDNSAIKEDLVLVQKYLNSYIDKLDFNKSIDFQKLAFVNKLTITSEDLENIIDGLNSLDLKSLTFSLLKSLSFEDIKFNIDIYTSMVTNSLEQLNISYAYNNKTNQLLTYVQGNRENNLQVYLDDYKLEVKGTKNNYKISLLSSSETLISASYVNANNTTNITISSSDYSLNLHQNEQNITVKASVNQKDYTLLISSKDVNKSFEKEDISNSTDIENLSSSDISLIESNLKSVLYNTKFYKNLLKGDYGTYLKENLGTFALEMVNASKDAYSNDNKITPKTSVCFDLTYLENNQYIINDGYVGSVLVAYNKSSDTYSYYFWITDGIFNYNAVSASGYNTNLVKEGKGSDSISNCGNSLSIEMLCKDSSCTKK